MSPCSRPALLDRLDRVAHQIEQRLLDLQHVHHHGRKVAGEQRAGAGVDAVEIRLAQRERLPDDAFDVHGARLLRSSRTSARRRRTTSAARSTCATAFLAVSATMARSALLDAYRVVDQARIGAGRHQRLVQFVRQRGGELAHAAEPRQA